MRILARNFARVSVYLNINYTHTVLSTCKNFYILIPQNSGPGLVLAWSWAIKCCVPAPKSSRIQSARRNSKYVSFDLKICVCIKRYVNFDIQSMFECFSQYWHFNSSPTMTEIWSWVLVLGPGPGPGNRMAQINIILLIDIFNTICKISQKVDAWVPKNPINDNSTLFPVMAWCHQPTSHHLSQCWLRYVTIECK